MQALLMALWRQKPGSGLLIRTDQGHSSPTAIGWCSCANTIWNAERRPADAVRIGEVIFQALKYDDFGDGVLSC